MAAEIIMLRKCSDVNFFCWPVDKMVMLRKCCDFFWPVDTGMFFPNARCSVTVPQLNC